MGQYYMPVIIDQRENPKVLCTAYSHEFNNGLKLMEHSWMGNKFVRAFESLLVMDGPVRVVWAGDYADPERDADGNVRKYVYEGQEYDVTLYSIAQAADHYRPDIPTWNRRDNYQWWNADGTRREKPIITAGKFDKDLKPNAPAPEVIPSMFSHPWLLNHDKGLAVDKRKVPKGEDGWRAHPLPLLTCEGNGRGGGDFHTEENYIRTGNNKGDFQLIGSWARDRVSLSKTLPKGFTVVRFDLTEG